MDAEKKDDIDSIVKDILISDGPDGHCDGSEIITDFIEALIEGKEKDWLRQYYAKQTTSRVFYKKDLQ